MKTKLVDPWWERSINPITGFSVETRSESNYGKKADIRKYSNAYPTLEIKST
jgi:hypothetical protein